jgi:hypothetical protein
VGVAKFAKLFHIPLNRQGVELGFRVIASTAERGSLLQDA